MEISKRTKYASCHRIPVQLYPIEAWDLLNILAQGSDRVLAILLACGEDIRLKG